MGSWKVLRVQPELQLVPSKPGASNAARRKSVEEPTKWLRCRQRPGHYTNDQRSKSASESPLRSTPTLRKPHDRHRSARCASAKPTSTNTATPWDAHNAGISKSTASPSPAEYTPSCVRPGLWRRWVRTRMAVRASTLTTPTSPGTLRRGSAMPTPIWPREVPKTPPRLRAQGRHPRAQARKCWEEPLERFLLAPHHG